MSVSSYVKGTILIVDDEEQVVSTTARVLERGGFTCLTYTDSQIAFERVLENDLDLIVSDIRMPRMTGITLARKLREEGYGTPILLFSGSIEPEDREAARQIRHCDVLQKPGEPGALVSRVDEMIQEHALVSKVSYLVKGLERQTESTEGMAATLAQIERKIVPECRVDERLLEVTEALVSGKICECPEIEESRQNLRLYVEKISFMQILKMILISKAFHAIFWPVLFSLCGLLWAHQRALTNAEVKIEHVSGVVEQFGKEQKVIRSEQMEIKRAVLDVKSLLKKKESP